jgi:hypothetical protein
MTVLIIDPDNIALQMFPRNLITRPLHFRPEGFFAADDEDRALPQVTFVDSGSGPASATPSDRQPVSEVHPPVG